HGTLRIRAAQRDGRHAVAHGHFGDALPHGTHHTRALTARDPRKGHRVNAGALVDLDEVDPTGRDVDDGFSRAGDRIGGLGGPQDFRTAGLLDNDGAHAWPPRIRGHRARATGQTLLLRPFPLPAVQLVHGKVVEDDHDVVASADSPAGQHAGLGGVFAVIRQLVGVDRLHAVLPV